MMLGLKTVLFCLLTIVSQTSFGQKTEVNLNAFGGLASFYRSGSTKYSSAFFNPYIVPSNGTDNPYGKKAGLSYALELQVQRISKKNIILGAGLSLERLASKVSIDKFFQNGFAVNIYRATGKTTLINSFITASPFLGHRFIKGKILIDIVAGVDVAFALENTEKGDINYENTKVSYINKKQKPPTDFRPKLQIKSQLNKYGFLLAYSVGTIDYEREKTTEASISFLRFGLSYQIK